jgi:hypothetical protein
MENYFATGSLAGVFKFPYKLVLGLLFNWVADNSENPLSSSNPNTRSFPQIKQYPWRKKGRRGLPAARLLQWGGRGCRGGLEGHDDVRVAIGDGRSRPVHGRRRESSSAARSLAYPGHNWPIKRVRELHQGSRRVCVCEELKNGSPDCSVYACRRVAKVWRGRSWFSGEVLPGPRAGKASQAIGEANRAAGAAWK